MRIMHINEASATGTLRISLLLATLQAESANEIIYVFSRRPETPKEFPDQSIDGLNFTECRMTVFGFLFSVLRLRRLIKYHNPHIVHLHSSVAGFIGRIALIGLPQEVFYTPHCIAILRKDLKFFSRVVLLWLERLANLRVSTYCACSASEYAAITSMIDPKSVLLIENGIEDDFPMHQSSSAGRGLDGNVRDIAVLNLGGVRRQKCPDKYSRIVARLNDRRPNLTSVWVGSGDPTYEEELRTAKVDLTGWLDAPQIKDLLSRSKVFLSTSEWEGMPVSVIEAMSFGVVPVLSDCEGNRDMVNHGSNGFLYVDEESAVHYITALLGSPSLWRKMSRQCINLYKNRHSARIMSRLYQEAYQARLQVRAFSNRRAG